MEWPIGVFLKMENLQKGTIAIANYLLMKQTQKGAFSN